MSISLTKNETVSLTKASGGSLEQISLGVGWGKKKGLFGGRAVDLDASCVLLDAKGNRCDQVWFRQHVSKCGSIVHSGDDRQGGGAANKPNEIINLNLTKIPADIKTIVLTINSYTGETFKGIPNAFVVITDRVTGNEEYRYNLTEAGGDHTGVILAKLERTGRGWEFTTLAEPANGSTINHIDAAIRRVV